MNNFRRLSAACVLALALALPAHAGQIPCGVAGTPEPTPPATSATPPATDADAGGVEAVLNLLLGVLAVL